MADNTYNDVKNIFDTGMMSGDDFIFPGNVVQLTRGTFPYSTTVILDKGTYLGQTDVPPYSAEPGTTVEGTLNVPFADGKEIKIGWNLGVSNAAFTAVCYEDGDPFSWENSQHETSGVSGSSFLSYPLTAQSIWIHDGWGIYLGTWHQEDTYGVGYNYESGILFIPPSAQQGHAYPDLTFDSTSHFYYEPLIQKCPFAVSNIYDLDYTSPSNDAAYAFFEGLEATEVPYDTSDGNESYPGAGGWRENINSPMDFPGFPSISAVNTGFTTLYKPTAAQLAQIASWLWSSDFFDNILKNFSDPFNNILGLFISPVTPTSGTHEFVVGNKSAGFNVDKVASQYLKRNCGKVKINKFYDSFADTDGFRDFKLYIPYYGITDISSDDFMGGTLEIEYNVDMLTGNAVASVRSNRTGVQHILHQYNCNIFTPIPLSGVNMMSYYSGLLGGAMNVVSGVASRNPMEIMSGASTMLNSHPTYGGSNTMAGNAGAMGIQYPYLLECRAVRDMPDYYSKYNGIPLNKTRTLSALSGYTEIESCRLNIASASDDEVAEILRLLKEGVIL